MTPPKLSKKDYVIQTKLDNPHLNLREIAEFAKTSHGYARNVWSDYCRRRVTKKGMPFPFFVKSFAYWNELPSKYYERCPIGPSDNRNLQKVYSTPYFSFVIHKNGSVFVYPFTADWKPRLRSWMITWTSENFTDLVLDNLVREPRKHVSFYTPGVPTKYSVRIKGIGRFVTDTTPYPKGTMEYEMDPFIEKRLNSIEKSMLVFADGMKQHMKMIEEVRSLVNELREIRNHWDKIV